MKKLLSLFLSAVMLLSCASQTVFAATTALTETEMESLETPLLTVFSDSGLPSERVNTTPSKYLFKSASGDSKQYILLKNVNANVSDKTEDVYFVMPEGIFFDIYTRQFLNVKEENNYVIRRGGN